MIRFNTIYSFLLHNCFNPKSIFLELLLNILIYQLIRNFHHNEILAMSDFHLKFLIIVLIMLHQMNYLKDQH